MAVKESTGRAAAVPGFFQARAAGRRGAGARPRPLGGVTGRVAASGTLDVTGNAVFAAATTQGPLVQAAVPAALYPLVTLLLARALST
jgi:hypothetical protein